MKLLPKENIFFEFVQLCYAVDGMKMNLTMKIPLCIINFGLLFKNEDEKLERKFTVVDNDQNEVLRDRNHNSKKNIINF